MFIVEKVSRFEHKRSSLIFMHEGDPMNDKTMTYDDSKAHLEKMQAELNALIDQGDDTED